MVTTIKWQITRELDYFFPRYSLLNGLKKLSVSKDMEFIDIIISAYSYVADILYGTKTYDDVITLRNIVPLYDLNEKIIAYYVTFLLNNNVLPNCPSNGNTLKSEWFNGFGGLLGSKIFENHKYCYVVVNNNVENPAAIEFGSGLNEIIENKLLYDSKSKVKSKIVCKFPRL